MAVRHFVGAFFAATLATGASAQDCLNPLNAGNVACIGFVTPQTTGAAAAATAGSGTGGLFGFLPLGGSGLVSTLVVAATLVVSSVDANTTSTTSTD